MFSATRPPEGLLEWDAWYQEHDGLMHGFALIAPDSLHPDARHDHARIGHFVSRNLVDWKQLPNVLTSQEGVLAHWTGSNIVEEE